MISFQTRFRIAMVLTFFPCLLLYPLKYPAREMMTLAAWLLPFPSIIGGFCVLLFPIMLSETYGYYFFNAICCIMTISLMLSAAKCKRLNQRTVDNLHRSARFCVLVTIAIAAIQNVTNPAAWMHIFSEMELSHGRGAGLRVEPASVSGPFVIYLSLLAMSILIKKKDQVRTHHRLFIEGIVLCLSILAVTRSIRVAIIILCFIPLFVSNLRYLMLFAACAFSALVLFAPRIAQVIKTSPSLVMMFTSGANSWRSIPDVAILENWTKFLLPSRPDAVREKMTAAIISAFGLDKFWLKNTYSTFAAAAVSFGLIATIVLFFAGLRDGVRSLSRPARLVAMWLLLYLVVWFTTPKCEADGWIALGFIVYVLRSKTLFQVNTGNEEL